MVDKSIPFDFVRTPNFLDNMNQTNKFNVSQMDGTTKNFEFVLASNCQDNIEDNLNRSGGLISDNTKISFIDIGTSGRVALNFVNIGGNNRSILSQSTDLVINMGDVNEFLKGIFLRNRTNPYYVLAYCILDKKIPVTGRFTIPKNSVVWNINDESNKN